MFGRQPVAETEVGVDESPLRQRLLQLHPQLANVDVDRAVSPPHVAAPDEAEQLLARHDPVRPPRQLCEQPQLADRQYQRPSPGPRKMLLRQNLERTYLECLAARMSGGRH